MIYIFGEEVASDKVKVNLVHYEPENLTVSRKEQGWSTESDPPARQPWQERFYHPSTDTFTTEKVRSLKPDDVNNIVVSVDKKEITADGSDTATITADITPIELGNHIDGVYVQVESDTVAKKSIDSNGEVTYTFSTNDPGIYKITFDVDGLKSESVYIEAV